MRPTFDVSTEDGPNQKRETDMLWHASSTAQRRTSRGEVAMTHAGESEGSVNVEGNPAVERWRG
ncbi:hypothetical protein [Luedemannella helvata]|uniref:hypothetical protein n=1 Tax=Luedemannella helvata TaxID=349315 RepID=UPI0031E02439